MSVEKLHSELQADLQDMAIKKAKEEAKRKTKK